MKRVSESFQVCVFCGSREGKSPVFRQTAVELGRGLVEAGMGLVTGGGHVGIMGVLADTMLPLGGSVTGVIPQALMDREVGHLGLTKLHLVENMHTRKQLMYDLSDAFLCFPGGFGTLDEIFEITTWKQLGFHEKPIIFLNVDGYFSPLGAFMDRAVTEGFVDPEHRRWVHMVSTVDEALALLARRG